VPRIKDVPAIPQEHLKPGGEIDGRLPEGDACLMSTT
jgi:hypothetical protein